MVGAARALLLGWGNATPSQLVVYGKVYRAMGLEPSTIIPSTPRGITRADAYARELAPVAAELEAEAGARPILVQLFSDNGFIAWAALLDALDRTEGGRRARAAIRGVVLDSSPGLWAVRGPLDFARRFALGMTPAVAKRVGLGARERLPIVTPLLALGFMGYQAVFRGPVRVILSASKRVAAKQPRCPHLFLYGDQDLLVPPRDIRAWAQRQRDLGIDVEEHVFAGGRHVALFPKDPKRYRSLLTGFAARVLTSDALPRP